MKRNPLAYAMPVSRLAALLLMPLLLLATASAAQAQAMRRNVSPECAALPSKLEISICGSRVYSAALAEIRALAAQLQAARAGADAEQSAWFTALLSKCNEDRGHPGLCALPDLHDRLLSLRGMARSGKPLPPGLLDYAALAAAPENAGNDIVFRLFLIRMSVGRNGATLRVWRAPGPDGIVICESYASGNIDTRLRVAEGVCQGEPVAFLVRPSGEAWQLGTYYGEQQGEPNEVFLRGPSGSTRAGLPPVLVRHLEAIRMAPAPKEFFKADFPRAPAS